MAHHNEARIREGYEAFTTGNMEYFPEELWTEDIVWHSGGHSSLAGDYKGAQEVLGFFGQLFERSGGTLRVELHDALANDQHGSAMHFATAERGGATLHAEEILIFHFRGDRVSEIWSQAHDQAASDTFWG